MVIGYDLNNSNISSPDLEKCEEFTLKFSDSANERTIYVFDYSGIKLNWRILKMLKDKSIWGVIKHPYVLNYINEVLIPLAPIYACEIFLYFTFLVLLHFSIHVNPSVWINVTITVLASICIAILLTKFLLKFSRDSSRWKMLRFTFGITFNVLTHVAVIFFVWFPTWFNYDDHEMEFERTISWLLFIIVLSSSWIRCLYVLNKSPWGPYILIMRNIISSFTWTIILWVPTLLFFASCFQLITRKSGTGVWKEVISNSSSDFMKTFQSLSKTAAMMIGELEAEEIIGLRDWIATLIFITFVIIVVVLLQNFMTSLAVGDVDKLKESCGDELLRIKVDYCIKVLQVNDLIKWKRKDSLPEPATSNTAPRPRKRTNNFEMSPLVQQNTSDTVDNKKRKQRVEMDATIEQGRNSSADRKQKNRKFRRSTLFKKEVKNIAVIYWKENTMFTKNIYLGSKETSLKDASKSRLDQVNCRSDENVVIMRKGHSKMVSIKLEDEESLWTKAKRWLIGINWNELQTIDKKSIIDQIDALKEQIQGL
ncbi:hypothetical protein FO519_009528 [Halicephalobus sp. NKZ332]|nr:hypothetical protein FO519_009528 [Halicephalobus sp. NKZ332]